MKKFNVDELQKLIEDCGVHAVLGPPGQGWGIEQNPYELAVFLTSIPEVQSVLEIGTGYRGGLARFLASCMGCEVTTVDIQEYNTQTRVPEVTYLVGDLVAFDREFDLVFIDAVHTYEGTSRLWKHYGRYGKIVAFHDILGLRGCEGVARFWKEFSHTKTGRMRKGYYEVIAPNQYAAGIGWVK